MRVLDFDSASQCSPACDHDDQKDRELDESEQVLQAKTPFQSETVNEKGCGNTSKTDAALVPSVNLNIGSVQNVFSKNDRV